MSMPITTETMPIVALIYDFDKTLCTKNMQEYKLIPDLGMTPAEFWGKVAGATGDSTAERILSYLYLEIKEARAKGFKLNYDYLASLGQYVDLYPGVLEWFKRINDFGLEHGVKVEHYCLSSGQKEIIDHTPIAAYFTGIYACEYLFDDGGEPIWPKRAINYTQKTQFLYRISKGAMDIGDDEAVNEHMKDSDKRVPFKNMIYIGDGLTDVPCMQIVKNHQGKAIAIYTADYKNTVQQLMRDDRVNYAVLADYSDGSAIDKIVKLQIEHVALQEQLLKMESKEV